MNQPPTFRSTSEKSPGIKYTLPLVLVGLLLLVVFLVWLFRSQDELTTVYGKRTGAEGRPSLNGTFVFGEMFDQAGNSVISVEKLSPRLRRAQTIVWFPDDFELPSVEQREYLEQWLAESPGRTLIYVGRDYDAATKYWQRILPLAPPNQAAEVQRQLAEAKSKFATSRVKVPDNRSANWFVTKAGSPRQVTSLQGPWAQDIDAKKADISLATRFDPPKADNKTSSGESLPDTVETRLSSDGDVLISRITDASWGGGQVFVVTNGSMLLNYPLINHENRKIAAKLIDSCDVGEVAFIESDAGGPKIEHRQVEKYQSEWPFPMNAIIFHLVMFAIILCLARSAIFGRPRRLVEDSPTDFGKHVYALGKLMQQSKDQNYAYARLQQYRQHGKRDSGQTHKPK